MEPLMEPGIKLGSSKCKASSLLTLSSLWPCNNIFNMHRLYSFAITCLWKHLHIHEQESTVVLVARAINWKLHNYLHLHWRDEWNPSKGFLFNHEKKNKMVSDDSIFMGRWPQKFVKWKKDWERKIVVRSHPWNMFLYI